MGPMTPHAAATTPNAISSAGADPPAAEYGWPVSVGVLGCGFAMGWALAAGLLDLACALHGHLAPSVGLASAVACYGAAVLLNPRMPASVLKGVLSLVFGVVCVGIFAVTYRDRQESLEAVLAASNVLVVPQAKKETIQLVVEGVVRDQELEVLGNRLRVPVVLYGPRAVQISVRQLSILNAAAARRYGPGARVNVQVEPAPPHTVPARAEARAAER